MSGLLALTWRDVRRAYADGGVTLTLAFFLLVAILFPFAVGPDTRLLGQVGGGIVWSAALLAGLLPVERLVAPDARDGTLDQLALRGHAMAAVAAIKALAHWLSFGPPLLLATLVAAALLGALRPFFRARGIQANWEAIEQTSDFLLVLTLAMICPFEPREKQALLEAAAPEDRAAMLVALLQMGAHPEPGAAAAPADRRPS